MRERRAEDLVLPIGVCQSSGLVLKIRSDERIDIMITLRTTAIRISDGACGNFKKIGAVPGFFEYLRELVGIEHIDLLGDIGDAELSVVGDDRSL